MKIKKDVLAAWLAIIAYCIFAWVFFLSLVSCSTKKQTLTEKEKEYIVRTDTFERVVYVKQDAKLTAKDSVHIRESLLQDYRFGRIDTVLNLRVDTVYRIKEVTKYMSHDEQSELTKQTLDCLRKAVTDSIYRAHDSIENVTVEQKTSRWQKFRQEMGGIFIAVLFFCALLFIGKDIKKHTDSKDKIG